MQVYLALLPGRHVLARLTQVMEAHEPTALLWLGDPKDKALEAVKVAAQNQDCAVLVIDAVDQVIEQGLDGVHLCRAENVGPAKEALGEDYIIGTSALDRHTAMEAGEAGAHYVMFIDPLAVSTVQPDLVTWWQEMMEIPCVGDQATPGDFIFVSA